jgi:uncharacterized protein YchJ
MIDKEEKISKSIKLSSLFVKTEPIKNTFKIYRNAPCFCGSGKKLKKCCLKDIEGN